MSERTERRPARRASASSPAGDGVWAQPPRGDGMSTATLLKAIDVVVPPELQDVLDGFGRTEDLSFSPDGRRLAIAGFGRDRIYLIEVLVRDPPGGPVTVALRGITELASADLRNPHGLSFLDDDTLVVANRTGDVVVLALPRPACGARVVHTSPMATIPAGSHGLASPGSVYVAPVALDLFEVLVCDNATDTVTRHLIDRRPHPHVVGGHVAVANGLEIPDSVTVSADQRWLAVSSHNTHAVLLYRNAPELGPQSRPDGVLRGICYPHGLRFTADGRFLAVADAGAPNVHVFASPDGDWSGEHTPAATHCLMDEACFRRGRRNPQEGGPKGLDIDRRGRLLAVTSEFQPLAVFDLRDVLPGADRPCVGPTGPLGPWPRRGGTGDGRGGAHGVAPGATAGRGHARHDRRSGAPDRRATERPRGGIPHGDDPRDGVGRAAIGAGPGPRRHRPRARRRRGPGPPATRHPQQHVVARHRRGTSGWRRAAPSGALRPSRPGAGRGISRPGLLIDFVAPTWDEPR